MSNRIPTRHWNYDELDDRDTPCMCVLCTRRRETAAWAGWFHVIPDAHGSFRCQCTACRAKRKADLEAIEAFNRHSVYSELTFAVQGHSWTDRFLVWAWVRITDPAWRGESPTEGVASYKPTVRYWWVHEAERKIIGSWLEDWLATDKAADTLISADRLLRGDAGAPHALSKRSAKRVSGGSE
jgi:hypothetical protein